MLSLENAKGILLNNSEILGSEYVSILDTLNRTLAEDIISGVPYPPFNVAPINGYALKSIDTIKASLYSPKKFIVLDEIHPGKIYEDKIQRGEAIKISKGSFIPDGCDCIVEEKDTNSSNNYLEVYSSYKSYENYCYVGKHIQVGKTIFRAGEVLNPEKIMKMASLGISKIKVVSTPIIGILRVGNELVDLDKKLELGHIYDSNSYYLYSRIQELGGKAILYNLLKDNEESIRNEILKAKSKCHIIISTGGISADKNDKVKQGATLAGFRLLFWRVDIKPGSNIFVAKRDNKLFIGLSGTPNNAISAFESIITPLVMQIQNNSEM